MEQLDQLELSRRSVTVTVKKCIYRKINKKQQSDKSLTVDKYSSLWEIQFAEGNFPNYFFCNPSMYMRSGEQQLYLKIAEKNSFNEFFDNDKSNEHWNVLLDIFKSQLVKLEKNLLFEEVKYELWQLHEQNPMFYEITTPIPHEGILKLPSEDLQILIDLALTDGATFWSNLIILFFIMLNRFSCSS